MSKVTKLPTKGAKKTSAMDIAPKATATESPLYVNSVEKAMRVLIAFDGRQRQLSLSQIAAATGLDLSAAQRFIFTLTTLGYLKKEEETKKYELSPKLLDFAYHYLASSELVIRATPYLQHLSQETEEATNLTILDGTDIVFVLRIVSRNVLNPTFLVGTRLPAYCTSPGLAIMSSLTEPEVDRILAQSNLVKHTPNTVIEPKAIKRRLAEFRQKGYAHTREEYYIGDISTAAAIKDAQGRPIGAVNVAVTKARWVELEDEHRFADLVISTASAISAQRRQES